jgi:hypothetical protein
MSLRWENPLSASADDGDNDNIKSIMAKMFGATSPKLIFKKTQSGISPLLIKLK